MLVLLGIKVNKFPNKEHMTKQKIHLYCEKRNCTRKRLREKTLPGVMHIVGYIAGKSV